MSEGKGTKNRWIWFVALLLFILVTATTICVLDRFEGFVMNDNDAISLTPQLKNKGKKELNINQETIYSRPVEVGTETSSNSEIWESETDIDLFHITYNNGDYHITVESDGEENIIAPGTDHSFIFKLKNTGEVAMDYDVKVEAYCTPSDTIIPIKGRLARYDGKVIAGEKNEHVSLIDYKQMKDKATLGAGRYLYYTLDWVWPFEQGNDELDTMLGNKTIKEEITFTVCIKTIATISGNPDMTIGIPAPSTGDSQPVLLWGAMCIIAICVLLVLLYYKKKDQRNDDDGEKKKTKQ